MVEDEFNAEKEKHLKSKGFRYIFDRMSWASDYCFMSIEYLQDHSRREIIDAVEKSEADYINTGEITFLSNGTIDKGAILKQIYHR